MINFSKKQSVQKHTFIIYKYTLYVVFDGGVVTEAL